MVIVSSFGDPFLRKKRTFILNSGKRCDYTICFSVVCACAKLKQYDTGSRRDQCPIIPQP